MQHSQKWIEEVGAVFLLAKLKRSGGLKFALFAAPAVICVLCEMYIPLVMTFFYSLTNWNGISRHVKFVGLKNFVRLFSGDSGFNSALLFTVSYTVFFVIVVNVLALLLAVILVKKMKLSNFMRAVFFIPYVMSLVVVGFIWKFILSSGFDSLYNATKIGIFKMDWLGNAHLAFIAVIAVSIWQAVGFYMVIYIAGLQSIPGDVLEAATVDGAGAVKKFFRVTLPMLMPSITICLFMSLTNAFKLYDIIVSLTSAGPGGSTASITYDIYTEEFQNNNYGYGCAKALVLFFIIAVITIIQVTLSKRKEVDL